MKRVKVVAAIFIYQGRLGLFRRSAGRLAGFWEFPGGKLEADESHEQALRREIFEELNVTIEIGRYVGVSTAVVGERVIELTAYLIKAHSGEFELREHDALSWQSIDQIRLEQISPLDRIFLSLNLDEES